ncbi:MAG TPA: lytic transglycosylase domain-containing protein [Clostridiaceae bacterium]|nr:lytic transglycosylase domain-containing protein [Clostridiaceae bacterium]
MFLSKKYGRKARLIVTVAIAMLLIVLILNNAAKAMFPLKYKDVVYKHAVEFNIDPYLVFAIIKAESSFNPNAVSSKGAVGLMQISETTGKWGAENLNMDNYSVSDLYDPEINIRIGCWYLSRLMKEFDFQLDLVVAAYNGGSGNVNEWLKNRDYSSSGASLDKIPFKETERFLKRVKNYHAIYKRLYG